ncbi:MULTISPECIES: hypothetical protein [unclassified Erythrobacter]|uniref:hypothetical protein n=1 Tax=unclassified Erythrobacter TaxID=2633097 RepID=UPI00076D7AD6|nr:MULTISPECIES: hypothetical protein [unclassified Erythrobacter]KWV96302.1 hypothetical protein ASS64_03595 [Erythrobacter sp. AP23]MBO6768995.1 hypothetical protein [Erythrobacter sp.]
MNQKEVKELEEIEREKALDQLVMIVRAHDLEIDEVLSVFPQFRQKDTESGDLKIAKKYDPIFNPY